MNIGIGVFRTRDFDAAHCADANRIIGNATIGSALVSGYRQKAHGVRVRCTYLRYDLSFVFDFHRPLEAHLANAHLHFIRLNSQ